MVSFILPAIKAVGKAQLKEILGKIQENNTKELYENTLKSVHANFALLNEVAIKSKTKIDDDIIELVMEAVEECADEDNVKL